MIRTALTHWRNSGALVRFIHKTFVDNNTKHSNFLRLFGIRQVSDRKNKTTTLRSIGRSVLSV